MTDEKIYPVKYKIEFGQFTKEELKQGDFGGCDALIIHSLIFPPDGSRSEMIMSTDKMVQPLSDTELFKSWVYLAHKLKDSTTLTDGKKQMCETVFKIVQRAVLDARGLEVPK